MPARAGAIGYASYFAYRPGIPMALVPNPRSLCLALAATAAWTAFPAAAVELEFDWPAGLDATVTFEGERTRSNGDRVRRTTARGSYRLTTEAVDGGLLLRYSDFVLEPDDDAPAEGLQREVQQLMTRIGSALPATVVAADGSIARFEGTAAMLEEFRTAFEALAARVPESARPRFRQALAQLLSAEVVERRMAESWNRDVGAWVGAELERGALYELEVSEPAPLLGNTAVPMTVTFEYLGPIACSADDDAPRCASLRMRSVIDADGLGEPLRRFIEKLAATGRPVPEFRDVRMETTVTVTTDPATLLPRQVVAEKVSSLTVLGNGQSQAVGESQTQSYEYRYR